MAATKLSVFVDPDVLADVRKMPGLETAPLTQIVRHALLLLAGRTDAATAAKLRRGRPPGNPRT